VEFIGDALATVGQTERRVVALLYGFGGPRHAPEEIARICGLSLHQIDQTATKVTRRMRHPACVRILREVLASADERIWRSMAGGIDIVYKSEGLTAISARVPGELLFAIECLYGSLENWLAAHARARDIGILDRAWYRSPFPEAEIERIATKLADEFPLPLPLEYLAREMPAEAPALETTVRLSFGHRLYSGYVAASGGARAPRAIRLHRILAGAHAGEVVPRRRLIALYRSEFADDDCSLQVVEVSMAPFPHLFLRLGDLGWCGIGAAGSQERSPDDDDDVAALFYRWSEERRSQKETPDMELVRLVLEEHGPLRPPEIRDLVGKRSKDPITAVSIAQSLNIGEEFLRLAPGVYGLDGQPGSDSQWAAARKLLLNRGACLRYILARWAGEPADAFPLWTPAMEIEWCEWAQSRQKKLLGSLLAVADLSSWPVPDSYRAVWLWKKECLQHFQLEEPAGYPLAAFSLTGLLPLVKYARWRGSANWVMANRVTGQPILFRNTASPMAFLVGVGAILPAPHWQRPHAIAPGAGEIDAMLSAELHRKGSLAWDGDSGRWLLDRLSQSIDRGETGWAPGPELQRLLVLLRNAGDLKSSSETETEDSE
jgi:hypothetical protein